LLKLSEILLQTKTIDFGKSWSIFLFLWQVDQTALFQDVA